MLAERIEAPIFVTGLGRSGTTLLHELLMQDPANRVPLLWETFASVPPPEPASWLTDPRAAAADLEITLMDAAVPAMTGMHENAGDLPTECIFLFAHQLATDMFTGEFHVPELHALAARAGSGAALRLSPPHAPAPPVAPPRPDGC